MVEHKVAYIRKDLVIADLSVPVGDIYYSDKEPLPYRWIAENDFEVFLNNIWQSADSIDWDFGYFKDE
ncbi:MAG: hypothetical protein ACE5GV_06515 [Candidatus Scalindua sp.]